ncbi:hypothetical protein T03_10471 [Trichinella britovi]|uniref:Uncharacterized protein n=1 Tax=Trichinella britovi TaxID=45882 RepID=A0A0V0ZSD9_TRIBR|nr:hypothetical protein T03_10471 [Trichinella britovi]
MSLQFTASKIVPATCCKIQILHNKIQDLADACTVRLENYNKPIPAVLVA